MLLKQKVETIKLSYSQQGVVDYMMKEKRNIEAMSIQDIASSCYTSSATLIRLAHKLGYDGFESLKKDFLEEIDYLEKHFISLDANYPMNSSDSIQSIAYKIKELEKETIDDTHALLHHDALQQAVQILKNAPTIYLSAISYPLMYAKTFQMNMSRLSKMVLVCDILGEELFLSSTMKKGDCLVMISYSGQIEKMIELARMARNKGVHIIVISSLGENALKQYGDVILNISTREKLYSKVGGFVNETSIKYILDVLYACYFGLDYDNHLEKRISLSKVAEPKRFATNETMKESEM